MIKAVRAFLKANWASMLLPGACFVMGYLLPTGKYWLLIASLAGAAIGGIVAKAMLPSWKLYNEIAHRYEAAMHGHLRAWIFPVTGGYKTGYSLDPGSIPPLVAAAALHAMAINVREEFADEIARDLNDADPA